MIFGTSDAIRFTVSSVELSGILIMKNASSIKFPSIKRGFDRLKILGLDVVIAINSLRMLPAYVSQSHEDGSKLALKVKEVSLTNVKEHVSS